MGQIVWSPMAQGVLSGKYLPGKKPPAGSRALDKKGGASFIERFMDDRLLERVQELRPLAESVGLTMPQFALAWALQNDNVSAVIAGASRPEQLVDNVGCVGVTLPAEVMAKVDQVLDGFIVRDPAKTWENTPHARLC